MSDDTATLKVQHMFQTSSHCERRQPPRFFTAGLMSFLSVPLYLVATLLAVSSLYGCAALGVAPAQSFDEQLAYAYGVHTAIEESAAAAKTTGALTTAEAQATLKLADQSRALLDSAHVLEAVNTASAGSELALATGVLTQLQQYLAARGVK